jgi:hypothetical protein
VLSDPMVGGVEESSAADADAVQNTDTATVKSAGTSLVSRSCVPWVVRLISMSSDLCTASATSTSSSMMPGIGLRVDVIDVIGNSGTRCGKAKRALELPARSPACLDVMLTQCLVCVSSSP